MKAFNNTIDKIITRLGKSNDSEIVTAILAAFKMVFVPIATLSDKKSSKEQKTYALTRDFLTEGVALAGYIGITGAVKNNLSAPICASYYKNIAKKRKLDINSCEYELLSNVDKRAIKNNAMNRFSAEDILKQQNHIKEIEKVVKKLGENVQNPKELYLNTKKIISHVSVCTLALTIIPFVTNKILEVISRAKINKKENENTFIYKNIVNTNLKPISINQYINFTKNTRVGGLNVFNR